MLTWWAQAGAAAAQMPAKSRMAPATPRAMRQTLGLNASPPHILDRNEALWLTFLGSVRHERGQLSAGIRTFAQSNRRGRLQHRQPSWLLGNPRRAHPMTSVRRLFVKAAVGACALAGLASSGAYAASPEGMKLYQFSSYYLDIAKSALSSATSGDEKIMVPVGFYLIRHPKGDVLFDTGDNDKLITDKTYWGPLAAMLDKGVNPDLAIETQLGKVGVKASDIKYVILGHMHLDHAGNVSRFPNATIVVQRDEIINAFWPPKDYAGPYISGDFEKLRSDTGSASAGRQPTIELNGDLDLFGDGSIYIHRAAGHTPGSQLAVVRLPKSGTIVLTSDTCYLVENLDKDILPSIGLTYNPTEMLNGYAYIKRVRDMEKGQVFMAHDAEGFKAHKQAPEFYE
jgi:glyoxylase-like metal-dependent hydrolase (beta-lactamase superfamily II)